MWASGHFSRAGEAANAKAEQQQDAAGSNHERQVETGERQLAALVRLGRGCSRRGRRRSRVVLRLCLGRLSLDLVLNNTAGLVVPALARGVLPAEARPSP